MLSITPARISRSGAAKLASNVSKSSTSPAPPAPPWLTNKQLLWGGHETPRNHFVLWPKVQRPQQSFVKHQWNRRQHHQPRKHDHRTSMAPQETTFQQNTGGLK